MIKTKTINTSNSIIPVIASLPYSISIEENEVSNNLDYNPLLQKTIYSMGRDYSTCREDESVRTIFIFDPSKSDTKRDD